MAAERVDGAAKNRGSVLIDLRPWYRIDEVRLEEDALASDVRPDQPETRRARLPSGRRRTSPRAARPLRIDPGFGKSERSNRGAGGRTRPSGPRRTQAPALAPEGCGPRRGRRAADGSCSRARPQRAEQRVRARSLGSPRRPRAAARGTTGQLRDRRGAEGKGARGTSSRSRGAGTPAAPAQRSVRPGSSTPVASAGSRTRALPTARVAVLERDQPLRRGLRVPPKVDVVDGTRCRSSSRRRRTAGFRSSSTASRRVSPSPGGQRVARQGGRARSARRATARRPVHPHAVSDCSGSERIRQGKPAARDRVGKGTPCVAGGLPRAGPATTPTVVRGIQAVPSSLVVAAVRPPRSREPERGRPSESKRQRGDRGRLYLRTRPPTLRRQAAVAAEKSRKRAQERGMEDRTVHRSTAPSHPAIRRPEWQRHNSIQVSRVRSP